VLIRGKKNTAYKPSEAKQSRCPTDIDCHDLLRRSRNDVLKSYFFLQTLRQSFNKGPDSVPRLSKSSHNLMLRADYKRRVIKSPVNHFCLTAEYRTQLFRSIAQGNYIIKIYAGQIIDALGILLRDINSRFSHYLDGPFIETCRAYSSRVGIDNIAFYVPCPALSHLASAGITRAEKQDFELFFRQIYNQLPFNHLTNLY